MSNIKGKMFYEYVKGALELISNAENEFTSFKDLSKGEIKIGCSTTLTKLMLLEPLKQFHIDYPNINIKIENNLTSNLITSLKLGKLDFVIFNEGDIQETGLKLQKIKDLKQGFVYNPEYIEDNIQDARKTMELNITDKIKISLEGEYPKAHIEYICNETLATLTEIADGHEDMVLETEGIKIKIKK